MTDIWLLNELKSSIMQCNHLLGDRANEWLAELDVIVDQITRAS